MKRLLILSFQYYRLILLYNLAFSVLVAALFLFDAHKLTSTTNLVAKTLGFSGAVLLYGYSYSKTYYYFKNAGITIWRLIITAFIIDVLIFLILAVIITNLESL